ncbi:hypothetical protein FACS1894172_08190 [Spirochaetia bacterium]|nr:hypothetical protein FACS1894164_07790 [Spirochaetia bacterium]GHU32124.1 hypothetical protein FACS1894172_08190 [Spirochaetia bacterium]
MAAINAEPNYANALVTRASAYLGKGDVNNAGADLAAAQKYASGNQDLIKSIENLKQKLQQSQS